MIRGLAVSMHTHRNCPQQGALLSRSERSVASHSVSYTEVSPFGKYEDGITFFIDPADQGACL
jgi:hypothetical protein